jgi:Ca2+-binding RTX toxin-like protein
MAEFITNAFRTVVNNTNDRSQLLFVDSTALINFDRIGRLDTLLAADRTVVVTPEVYREAVANGLASSNPVAFSSAQRIDSWLTLHSSLGDVLKSAPNRAPFTGSGAGEASIKEDVKSLGGIGSPIVVSDDNHIALQNLEGSSLPALTGDYYLNSLLVGGALSPVDYFLHVSRGAAGGFNQRTFPGDTLPVIADGVVYQLDIDGVPRGSYVYRTVGSSSITCDGRTIYFAPYEKGGIRNDCVLKVTDASDGSHTDTYFDTANLNPWVKEALAYDPQGRVVGKDAVNDDGTTAHTDYDVSGAQPWLSQTLIRDINGVLQMQQDVLDSGGELLRYYDTQNTHPYTTLDITRDILGHITGASATPDANVAAIGGSIGQVLGSAIGRALAPNNQFAQLAAGTVAGAIGQRLAQTFSSSLDTNATGVAVGDIFNNFGINLASAGAGSVASFLTAEIGTALGLSGYGAQLFNASVGGFAGSVAQQVALYGMGQINGINWGAVFTSVEVNIGGALGSMLAHRIVQAQTQAGAIGGQIAGAIGSAIGAAIVGQGLGLVLNIVIPGLGSLVGTILGTLLGDVFGGHPTYPLSIDYVSASSYLYGHNNWSVDDGGDPNISLQMSGAVANIVNAYLTAANGLALGHSKPTYIGYQTAGDLSPYLRIDTADPVVPNPNGTKADHASIRYATAEEVVNAAALDLLKNTEVIGGELLLKRAHQHSQYATTMTLAADLQVAQDYENYLNNREAINALIAGNPNTAFAAGWIATFARVNDLGLNQYGASDFLGGMLLGYFDSVRKAGLSFSPSNVSVKRGGDGSVIVEIHVGGNVDIPGALDAFASHTNVISDSTGKTIQLVFADGLAAGGFQGPASATFANGVLQYTAAGGNNIWFGRDDYPSQYVDGQASSQDILLGGAMNDVIYAGNGWDFVDGGAGHDYVSGRAGNDILRGGAGNDTIDGGDGADALVGGAGLDTLTGGSGADLFSFATGDSPGGQHDRITDFTRGEDAIDLSRYDANSWTAERDTFRFIGSAPFDGFPARSVTAMTPRSGLPFSRAIPTAMA